MLVGRVGVQVAALRLEGDAARLVPLEGGEPPRCNGVPIPAAGISLKIGDRVEVASTALVIDSK
jgi:hypothetical protein